MMIRRSIFLLCLFLSAALLAFGQNLPVDMSIGPGDFQLEQRDDGGFHLFIRKKPDIASVLLTESTRDPAMEADNFAYRAAEWNPINGDEIRLLSGYPIPRDSGIYSLISSTPEPHPELEEAFHIFVPWVVYFGYENTRNGEVSMEDGTYINIRAFNYPYGDYRGDFADNPFVLQAVQRPVERPNERYMDEAETAFIDIARRGGGNFVYAEGPADLIVKIEELLKKEAGKSVDIVLCLDATGSMGRYIDSLKRMLIPAMRRLIADFTDWRIGMVLYRDYPPDAYITRVFPFTRDFSIFQRNLNAAVAWGGGDVPEAVFEAIYEGAEKFPWAAESRLLILIGDAPPHPVPKGAITEELALEKAAEKYLKVNAILLPQ